MTRARFLSFVRSARGAVGDLLAPSLHGVGMLRFAIALSLALHAALLLIQVRMPEPRPNKDQSLEVVLVNARHAQAPNKADVLAQANLDGGGNSERKARPAANQPARNAPRDGNAPLEARRQTATVPPAAHERLTRDQANARIAPAPKATEPARQPVPEPATSGLDLLDSVASAARLEAQIERNMQELANRPRRKFIGARAQEYRFAQYVEDWRAKVERIGTLNFPEAARGKVYGNLLLTVAIRADGTLDKVELRRSSGHAVLDQAAMRIVRMASPFAPFPPDIRKDYEVIEITRTWTFTNHDQVRTD